MENKLDEILSFDDEDLPGEWHYLDFFPKTFQEDNDLFDEFETFMQKDYFDTIAPKIAWIIVGMISYFDAEVYLEDGDYGDNTLNSLLHKDLLEYLDLREIGSLIQSFCKSEKTGLNIALKNQSDISVITFDGGTRVSFYLLTDEQKELARDLVIAQGFYFKNNDGTIFRK